MRTVSVQTPGPVRSRVSTLVDAEKAVPVCRAMWSQISRSAGCPGAPANVHCNTCGKGASRRLQESFTWGACKPRSWPCNSTLSVWYLRVYTQAWRCKCARIDQSMLLMRRLRKFIEKKRYCLVFTVQIRHKVEAHMDGFLLALGSTNGEQR